MRSELLQRTMLRRNALDSIDDVNTRVRRLEDDLLSYWAGDRRYVRRPSAGPGGVMPVFNVIDLFKATGDGATDDTMTIQAALDQAAAQGSGVVFVPGPGTYIIGEQGDGSNDGLRLYDNTFLALGPGAVLKAADGSDLKQVVYGLNATNIGVVGWGALGEIDGNKANQTANNLHGVRFNTCDHFLLSNLYIHDVHGAIGVGNEGTGIHIDGATPYDAWGMITNCITEDIGGLGIGTYRARRVVVTGCISRNNDSQGFSFSGDDTAAGLSRNIIQGCHAQGNGRSGFNFEHQAHTVCTGCVSVDNGALGGFRVQDGDTVTIADGISVNDQNGVVVTSTSTGEPQKIKIRGMQIYGSTAQGIDMGADAGTANDFTVEDCTVQATGAYGIYARSTVDDVLVRGCLVIAAGATGILSNHTRNGVFAGNIVRSCTDHGIHVQTSTGSVALTGNTCERNGQHGILVQDIADEIGGALSGNVCHENSQTTGNNRDGINITDCACLAVTGNTCTDAQATATQRYGIREGGTCDWNSYVGNVCRGNNTNQLSESGTNNKAAHNIGVATHDT